MDLSSLIIGVLFLAACALPFVVASSSRKHHNKKLIDELNGLAGNVATEVSEFEIMSNKIAGIDKSGRYFFFVRIADGIHRECVSIDSLKSCGVTDRNSNSESSMGLCVIQSNGTERFIEFYNSKVEATSEGEIDFAEKWNCLINRCLKPAK